MRPYSHYMCGAVSYCLVYASLAITISLESRSASAIPCDEAVLPERTKVDLFQNAWRWVSNSRQFCAPPSLLVNCEQVQTGFSLEMHGGSESQVKTLHGNDMCNSSLSTAQTLPLSPYVLYSGLPVGMAVSSQCTLYHASAEPVVVSLQKLREHLGQQYCTAYKLECLLE